jgi:hypothetical protein
VIGERMFRDFTYFTPPLYVKTFLSPFGNKGEDLRQALLSIFLGK